MRGHLIERTAPATWRSSSGEPAAAPSTTTARVITAGAPGDRAYRGRALPAMIRNMNHYLVTVDVYDDGAIDAWGFVDRAMFDAKLSRWVVTSAPDGALVSAHHLCAMKVRRARWRHTVDSLRRDVDEALASLARPGEAPLDLGGSDTEARNNSRYAKMGLSNRRPVRVSDDGASVRGAWVWVLLRAGDGALLTRWFAFADGSARIGDGAPRSFDESVDEVRDRGLRRLRAGARVTLDDLGDAEVELVDAVSVDDKVTELRDELAALRGEPGVHARAHAALKAWRDARDEATYEALHAAYHAVPEHQRAYLGDMDSRDAEFRAALREGRAKRR